MLKLIAFDAEDLAVVSAHTQDAVLKVADLAYQPAAKRFVALLNRFDWSSAAGTPRNKDFERRQSLIRFERVMKARLSGLDIAAKGQVLELLAISYERKDPEDPAGTITLFFAGDGAIQLDVECIEAELKDLGPCWSTHAMPSHPEPAPGRSQG